MLYYLIGKRKAVAYANLRAAFRGRYNPSQLKMIIREQCHSLSQSFIELLKFPLLGNSYVDRYIKVEGEDKIKVALKKGNGVILLTAHFGNWELSSLVGAIKGYRMNVLARWQKFERLNGYLNKMRSFRGANVISKDDARVEITQALNNNEIVGILSDQDGGKRGEFVEFLGRLSSTPKGVAHFSLRTGAPILPVFIIRRKGPSHRIVVEDDISVVASENINHDIHQILQRFADVLRRYIEQYPGQWLWLHKRWKSTPTRYILILSDGKAGHLRQSASIANAIKNRRIELGYKEEDTKAETVEVRFKNGFARAIFDIFSYLGFNLNRISFCFAPQALKDIQSAYADYIVSCGASLAGVNRSLKRELKAKSIVIMRPNIYNVRDYDLAIIPAHDRPERKPNVVVTTGAVTDSAKGAYERYAAELKGRFNVIKNNVIGILIGGDSKAYTLSPELIDDVLEEILLAADDLDADMLLTTSRRTSRAVEEAIRARLDGSRRTKLLLIANENNFDGAVEGIIGLSNILVVSGDSIAMVTEAVEAGKMPLIFMPRKKRAFFEAKHKTTIKNLETQRKVIISDSHRLKSDILNSIKLGIKTDATLDSDSIRTAIAKFI